MTVLVWPCTDHEAAVRDRPAVRVLREDDHRVVLHGRSGRRFHRTRELRHLCGQRDLDAGDRFRALELHALVGHVFAVDEHRSEHPAGREADDPQDAAASEPAQFEGVVGSHRCGRP